MLFRVADVAVTHPAYMHALGVSEPRYPSVGDDVVSGDPRQLYRDLHDDLQSAGDFLFGDATVLRAAAQVASVAEAERGRQLMAESVGDTRKLQRMRDLFRQNRYAEVVALARELQMPGAMSAAERRMVELARARLP